MKDPAVLLYVDKWLISTKGMKSDAKGWYLNLILYQHDIGDLPSDIEELANLCDVRFSEFNKFEQVFEQVLKQRFKVNEKGRLFNEFAAEILQKRQKFVEKRSMSGKLSYLIKYARKYLDATEKQINFLKENLNVSEIDTKNEQVFKQVLKQKLELYINEDEDEDLNVIKGEVINKKRKKTSKIILPFDSSSFAELWDRWKSYKAIEHKFKYKSAESEQAALIELSNLCAGDENNAGAIIMQSMSKGWKGFFQLTKNNNNGQSESVAEITARMAAKILEKDRAGGYNK